MKGKQHMTATSTMHHAAVSVSAGTRIHVIDRDGREHHLEWLPGQSLMEALRDNGLPVLASCGGRAACATCHVFLDANLVKQLGARHQDEQELVEETQAYDPETSRLSCQVHHDVALDGITVHMAPEEE
jgi:2Fe-2S ferredoxin